MGHEVFDKTRAMQDDGSIEDLLASFDAAVEMPYGVVAAGPMIPEQPREEASPDELRRRVDHRIEEDRRQHDMREAMWLDNPADNPEGLSIRELAQRVRNERERRYEAALATPTVAYTPSAQSDRRRVEAYLRRKRGED